MQEQLLATPQGIPDKGTIESAKIFSKEPLTPYQLRINQEAGNLALQNPALLSRHGELLEIPQKEVVEQGYQFKKGKLRSNRLTSDIESETVPKATQRKLNMESRHEAMQGFREQIAVLDEQLQVC